MKKKFMKIRKILEECYYEGKLHNLTMTEIKDITICYNKLCDKPNCAETICFKTAKLFEKNGFKVSAKGIGYTICV